MIYAGKAVGAQVGDTSQDFFNVVNTQFKPKGPGMLVGLVHSSGAQLFILSLSLSFFCYYDHKNLIYKVLEVHPSLFCRLIVSV